MIQRGELVGHRLGKRNIRVDALSVMRLLATPADAVARDAAMKSHKLPTTPTLLLRQRGKAKEWTALVHGEEVGLGTDVAELASSAMAVVTIQKTEGEGRRRDWRVFWDERRGAFVARYYDSEGRRRLHRVPREIRLQEEAERHTAEWFAELVGRAPPATELIASSSLSSTLTFEQFGTLWTSGRLARMFSDHVRPKATAADDESRLRLHVYPIIGSFRVAEFEGQRGLELVERVLQRLPVAAGFSRSSRRQVLQAIHRLLTLAVYPAKLITANPLPKGFLPKPAKGRAKGYLYPSEDRQLLACLEIPLLHRLFYGLLTREGLRVSEALSLTWNDVDLERGVLHLAQNKTDDARSWAVDVGVAEGLRRWRRRFGDKAQQDVSILVAPDGTAIDRFEAARSLREHLRLAGVSRRQLFETDESRMAIRAHDLRATFITVNLALGKTEAWITDRTGHRSSQMIYTYKRAARTLAELNLGGFTPLHEAIPELRK
jgi:integrase